MARTEAEPAVVSRPQLYQLMPPSPPYSLQGEPSITGKVKPQHGMSISLTLSDPSRLKSNWYKSNENLLTKIGTKRKVSCLH